MSDRNPAALLHFVPQVVAQVVVQVLAVGLALDQPTLGEAMAMWATTTLVVGGLAWLTVDMVRSPM